MTEPTKHIFFLGIAGIGVSALAQVAIARGARVSGSDPHADPTTNPAIARLQEAGARLYTRHAAENLEADVDLVVASAAIAENNPEILAARSRGTRIISRADYLGELMEAHRGVRIGVAGTHGKTTTTAMIGVMLEHAGLDPTVFVGGEVPQLGGNVRVGDPRGPFVAEACEAYDSFLTLRPDIAVITNVEADHLDHYGDLEHVHASFKRFLGNVPEDGRIVGCADDPGAASIAEAFAERRETILYGLDAAAESRGEALSLSGTPGFEWRLGDETTAISLAVPGRHNVLNALAAATVGHLVGASHEQIAAGLAQFRGAERRQETLGEIDFAGSHTALVIDDYAHHPTEIRATLTALRQAYPGRKLIAVFQPHLFSRTRDFLPEFASALAAADTVVVTDIYAAREAPIPGVLASDIVAEIARTNPCLPAHYVAEKRHIPALLLKTLRPDDVVVFLGAGDIREEGEALLRAALGERAQDENRAHAGL